jgi:hypothetical protein
MPTGSKRIPLALAFGASMFLLGCAPKKPIASTQPSFRVETFHHDALLFAPTIPASQSSTAPVRLNFKSNANSPLPPSKCSAESGPFRLQPAIDQPAVTQITLPAPERWLGVLQGLPEADGADDFDSLYSFLAALDRFQQTGCFPSDTTPARDYVLQSLPMKPAASLFNAYGYLLGRSGLDLKPGLQIKIVRAYFRPASPGEEEHAIKNYLGLSTIIFDVEHGDAGKVRFHQIGNAQYAPESLAQASEEGNHDGALRDLTRGPYYRVLFYTYLVPKEHRIAAAIIGAGSLAQLDAVERALRALPEDGCKNPAVTANEDCLEFKGFVTLSTQINVELDGKVKFVDWGTNVGQVLPKNSLRYLQIQRRFLDTYYDVHFDPADPSVLSLALIGGDRLSWSKSPRKPH